jgi:hypothetical protein
LAFKESSFVDVAAQSSLPDHREEQNTLPGRDIEAPAFKRDVHSGWLCHAFLCTFPRSPREWGHPSVSRFWTIVKSRYAPGRKSRRIRGVVLAVTPPGVEGETHPTSSDIRADDVRSPELYEPVLTNIGAGC